MREDDLIEMKYNENVTVELFNTILQIPASLTDPGKFSFLFLPQFLQ